MPRGSSKWLIEFMYVCLSKKMQILNWASSFNILIFLLLLCWWVMMIAMESCQQQNPKIGMQLTTTKQKLPTSMPTELSDLCKAQIMTFFSFFPFWLLSFLLQIGRSNPYHQRHFLLVVLGFKDFKGLGLRVQQCHNSINFGAAPDQLLNLSC